MLPPCGHETSRSLNSGLDEAKGDMPRAVDPATFDSFPSLPAEIHNGVWLALERPATVKAYAYRFNTYDPLYEVRSSGFNLLVPCGCGRQACRRCKNMDLMKDPNLAILFATGNCYQVEEDVPELVAPSTDFLNRIHRVTIDLADRDPYLNPEEWPFLLSRRAAASRHRELAASLRRDLPSLSTFTILVEPMRCENAEKPNPDLDEDFYGTTDNYYAERVFLLQALTSLVEVNHARGCDRSPERCSCLSLPFPKMRTLVVRVDTREKLTYLCTFDDTVFLRSRFIVNAWKNVLVFKKGSIPLLSNCLGMLPWS